MGRSSPISVARASRRPSRRAPFRRRRGPLPFRESLDRLVRPRGRPEAKDLQAAPRHAAGDARHRGDAHGPLPALLEPGPHPPRLRRLRLLPRSPGRRDRGVARRQRPRRARPARMTEVAVALDGMGGDDAPAAPVAGALEAARGGRSACCWSATSPRCGAELARQGARRRARASRSSTRPSVIGSGEEGARAVRAKPERVGVHGLPPGGRGPGRRRGRRPATPARRSPPRRSTCAASRASSARRSPWRCPRAGGRPVVLLDAGASAEARPSTTPSSP